ILPSDPCRAVSTSSTGAFHWISGSVLIGASSLRLQQRFCLPCRPEATCGAPQAKWAGLPPVVPIPARMESTLAVGIHFCGGSNGQSGFQSWVEGSAPAISGRETPWLVSGQAVPSRKTIQSGRESWLVDAAATPQRKPPAGKGATARFDGVDCDAGIFLFARPPMSTAPLYHQPGHGPRISFELYPPRTPRGGETLRRTVAELAALEPDFFSVTYGASGKTRETS